MVCVYFAIKFRPSPHQVLILNIIERIKGKQNAGVGALLEYSVTLSLA